MLLKLSGGLVALRLLKLYELDNVEFVEPAPFVYEYVNKKTGRVTRRVYRLEQWTKPPVPPAIPEHECEPNSYEGELWHVYNTYQAALLHRMDEIKAEGQFCHDTAAYVLANCLYFPWWLKARHWLLRRVGLSQVKRPADCVITPEDYTNVYRTVLVPEVGAGDIERVLRDMFPGFFRGQADIRGDGDTAQGQGEGSHHPPVGRSDPASVGA